jgi:hypothetical protein
VKRRYRGPRARGYLTILGKHERHGAAQRRPARRRARGAARSEKSPTRQDQGDRHAALANLEIRSWFVRQASSLRAGASMVAARGTSDQIYDRGPPPLSARTARRCSQRGETQALVDHDARDDARRSRSPRYVIRGDVRGRSMLHYNFPPFSTGEVKPLRGPVAPRNRPRQRSPSARCVGCMPAGDRVPLHASGSSPRTSSRNGSSSMAAVCGGCARA